MPSNAAELLELLDLERLEDNLFRGVQQPTSRPRVFGGQVAAQALVAATRTVDPSHVVHSFHSYFLQPGDTTWPTIFDVEALRDGRSFATRRVLARQHGRPIFAMTADYHRPESGPHHQDAMPGVPGPEDPAVTQITAFAEDPEWSVVEVGYVGNSVDGRLPPDDARPGRQAYWMRVGTPMPDDPFSHVAAFAFLSDMTLTGAALAPHGERVGSFTTMVASLDHAVWFHEPFRVDEWYLYDQVSPYAGHGRGLVTARVFTADGRLVADVAQEALLRPRKEAP